MAGSHGRCALQGSRRGGLAALAAIAAVALWAAPLAAARVEVSGLAASFSSLQAGGSPDLQLTIDLASNPASDDPRDLVITLPQGLVANPLAAQRCPVADFKADACPAGAKVGSTTVRARVEALLGAEVTANGDVYNLVPGPGEPARLGVVVRPPLAGAQHYQVTVRIRGDRGFVIENVMSGLERTAGGLPIRIEQITLALAGSVAGKPFLRLPTSCRRADIAVAVRSWDEPQVETRRTVAFTPVRCERVPFRPSLSGTMGAAGATSIGATVPVTASVITFSDDAAVAATTVSLPRAVGVNLRSLSVLCDPAAFAADRCPPETRVGTARLASPLVERPLELPVYIVRRDNELPALGFRLYGGSIIGRTKLGERVTNIFAGLPDLPLSRFDLTVDGGPRGLLQASSDLCNATTPRDAEATFSSHSGIDVTISTPFGVDGCPPGATRPPAATRYRVAHGLAVRGESATLLVRVSASRPLARAVLTLPPQLAATRRSRATVTVGGRRLRGRAVAVRGRSLRLRATRPGRTLVVTWRGLRAARSVVRALRARRTPRLAVRLTVVESSGARRAFRLAVRARRR